MAGGQRRGRWTGVPLEDRQARRRDELLAAGLQLLGATSGPAVTVRAVCRQTGLTERYFYESFPNREALLLAAYAHVIGGLRARIVAALLRAAPTPEAVTRAGLEEFFAAMRDDPAQLTTAQDCAARVGLSFSRFLHLFKAEVGTPFRSLRTWKRARSLLHHVTRDTNLVHVALDTGYPDSTHFSHSIRQVYGLKPRDLFAGSRQLIVLGDSPAARAAARATNPCARLRGRAPGRDRRSGRTP